MIIIIIINRFVHINGFSGSALGYEAILSKSYRLILYYLCPIVCYKLSSTNVTLSLYVFHRWSICQSIIFRGIEWNMCVRIERLGIRVFVNSTSHKREITITSEI